VRRLYRELLRGDLRCASEVVIIITRINFVRAGIAAVREFFAQLLLYEAT